MGAGLEIETVLFRASAMSQGDRHMVFGASGQLVLCSPPFVPERFKGLVPGTLYVPPRGGGAFELAFIPQTAFPE